LSPERFHSANIYTYWITDSPQLRIHKLMTGELPCEQVDVESVESNNNGHDCAIDIACGIQNYKP